MYIARLISVLFLGNETLASYSLFRRNLKLFENIKRVYSSTFFKLSLSSLFDFILEHPFSSPSSETFFLVPRSIKIGKLAALKQNYFNKFHIEIRVLFRISFLPRLTSVRKESEHKRQQFDSSRHLSDSAWFLTFNSR